jgi:tetratricopeptide (TPR) repeat protein
LLPRIFAVLLAQTFLYQEPATDGLIRAAMRANYELNFDESGALSRRLETMYPDHPVGYLLEAERYWWEAQADPDNKMIEKAYYAAQKSAVEKGLEALKYDKYARTETLSYLASSYGSLARFQLTRKNAYYSAMRAGMKAIRYAQQVYQTDPSYYDVYAGLGAYNYFTAVLPAVIKPFAFLMGLRGQKELGLEQLRVAMDKSHHSRTEAKIVYYAVLLEEKRYPEALRLLEELTAEFPDNFVFYDWISSWFEMLHRLADGIPYFDSVAGHQLQRSPLQAQHALLKEAFLQHAVGRDTDARQTLRRLRSIPGADRLIEEQIVAVEKAVR